MRSHSIEKFLIPPSATIQNALECLNSNARGIVLVVDEESHLLGTITDGDIRRAILSGQELNTSVDALLASKADSALYSRPITALVGTPSSELLRLMRKYVIRQIPLVDENNTVVDLVMLEDLLPEQEIPLQAVIMAGGQGTRLRPLTENLPKPMLPVGDRPLMERVVEQLRQAGIRQVNVTTHYLGEKIREHFGDGSRFGIRLNYVTEEQPLGTAGALGLMETPEEPLLVINGDILTKVNFRAMLDYHKENRALLTMAVRRYDFNLPYGVVESEGALVKKVVEKPVIGFFVNAGIYLLEPAVYRYIPRGERFDMTDLIDHLLADDQRVASFPIVEYWLDIGQPVDYQQAQEDVKNGRLNP